MKQQGRIKWTRLGSYALVLFSLNAVAKYEPEAVPGEYLVKLKGPIINVTSGTFAPEMNSMIKSVIPGRNILVVQRPKIELSSYAISALKQNKNVLLVEPNYIYRMNAVPNDPDYSKLWGLKNVGQTDGVQNGTEGVDINVEKAWDLTTGSSDVLVAVIDTGIDYNHPDLKENVWSNSAELVGQPGVDDDGNGFIDDIHGYDFSSETGDGDPLDDHGHGSHCSGTIGAKGGDSAGIVGVNWNVKIIGVKFLNGDGSGTLEGAIKAIDYAVKMNAKVLSNSWGGGGESLLLKEAIERSNAAGTVFVAAAGNNASNNDTIPGYPASYDVANIISVAAIDNKGDLANFSNYGKRSVHVAAPGVKVFSSLNDGKYDSWSGTSMATPHVSGVAALLLAYDTALTAADVKNRIVNTARPLSTIKRRVLSGGIVDAYAALMNQAPQPDPNDPANWQTVEQVASTAHPYLAKTSQTFELSVPGASEISVYFSRFQTEKNYDFVSFYDEAGNLLGQMHGENDDSFSPVFKGSFVKIVFSSDDSIQGYGFDVSKIAFR